MSIQVLGQVGEQSLDDGMTAPFSLNTYGQLAMQSSLAAAAEQGRVFSVCAQTGTTTQAGLNTAPTAPYLINPAGSGVTGRLWFASAGSIVANATAGTIWLAVGTDVVAATQTGTLTTAHRCWKLGGITPASQGNRISAVLATIALGYAPVGADFLGVQLTAAITTIPAVQVFERCYYGALLIQPGCNVGFQTSVASGASGFFASMVWEECDLIT